MFNTKTIRVSLPKSQVNQLKALVLHMRGEGNDFDLDDVVELVLAEFIDRYFSDTAKRVSKNLKRLNK